jgi:hypothetical protein
VDKASAYQQGEEQEQEDKEERNSQSQSDEASKHYSWRRKLDAGFEVVWVFNVFRRLLSVPIVRSQRGKSCPLA